MKTGRRRGTAGGGGGNGRMSVSERASLDADGAIAYTYAYHAAPNGGVVQYKTGYSDIARTTLVMTYEYNTSGVLIKKTLADGTIYEYDSLSRVTRELIPGVTDTSWTYFGATSRIDVKTVIDLE